MNIPLFRRSTFGTRAFSVAGPDGLELIAIFAARSVVRKSHQPLPSAPFPSFPSAVLSSSLPLLSLFLHLEVGLRIAARRPGMRFSSAVGPGGARPPNAIW